MNVRPDANELDWIARLSRGSFSASAARGAPLIVARDPAHLVYATNSALAVFGVRDLAALERVLFESASFGARRLQVLARTLTPGAPPRLESLRFFVGRVPVAISWLCARVLDEHGEAMFIAAAPSRAVEAEGRAPSPDPWGEATVAPPESRLRFLWSLDGEGRFAAPDPALVERLGADSPREGETTVALAARVGLEPHAAWSESIEARKTFSALQVVWPMAGAARGRVALISGTPALDRDRDFAGFRGFGVLTGEWTAVEPARHAQPSSTLAPEAESEVVAAAPELFSAKAPEVEQAEAVPAVSEPSAAESLASPKAILLDTPTQTPALEAETRGDVRTTPDKTPAMPEEPATAPPRYVREKGGEILAFRPGSAQPAPLIRPGVFSVLNALSTVADSPRGGESVALTPQERDAFKEIARTLGVRLRSSRPDAETPDPASSTEPAATAEPPVEAVLFPALLSEPTLVSAPALDPAFTADPYDLARLLDELPIGALVIRDSETLYLNQTLLDLVGYSSLEDFRERNGLAAIYLGRDPQAFTPIGEDAGTPLIAAGGEMITVDAQARPVSWQGAPAVLIAMRRSYVVDHQAEVRALELERHQQSLLARDFSSALEAVSDGLVRVDSSGRILAMNGGAEKLLGYDQKETAGESLLMFFAAISQAEVTTALDRVVRAESVAETHEFELSDRSGRITPVRADFGRFVAAGVSEFFVVLRDLSRLKDEQREREAAREVAEKASAAKTEFLARVSHEIRTPLHAILGFAEVMLEERFGPVTNDRYKDYIRDIHTSGRHVMSLANDLLDLAKIEAGKMELQFSAVDVNRVIRECVGLMQPQAARERIIVRLSLYDKLPQVMADERSLRQIVFNLLSNAVKYNEPGGQVIVSTALDDEGHTIVRVRDTGVGMNEAELASALQPFQRLAGARKTEGTGLGLPLTKALAEANHADFAIKSAKEQGTLVEVAFPALRSAS